MSYSTLNVKLKIQRGNSAYWELPEHTLLEGELGIDTDTRELRIGKADAPQNGCTFKEAYLLSSDAIVQRVLSLDEFLSNVFTDDDRAKLAGIEAGAEVNVQANWNESNSNSDAYIKNKPDLTKIMQLPDEVEALRQEITEELVKTSGATMKNGAALVIPAYNGSESFSDETATRAFLQYNNASTTGYQPLIKVATKDGYVELAYRFTYDGNTTTSAKLVATRYITASKTTIQVVFPTDGEIAITDDISNSRISIEQAGNTVDSFTLNQFSDQTIKILPKTDTQQKHIASGALAAYTFQTIPISITNGTYVLNVKSTNAAFKNAYWTGIAGIYLDEGSIDCDDEIVLNRCMSGGVGDCYLKIKGRQTSGVLLSYAFSIETVSSDIISITATKIN